MEATIQAWKMCTSQNFIDQVIKPLPLTISSFQLIIPDLHISHWITKGIGVVEDLLVGPSIKTFGALQLEYGLDNNDHYRYLQIAHFIQNTSQISTMLPWRASLYLTNPTTNIKGMSLFYNLLNNKKHLYLDHKH